MLDGHDGGAFGLAISPAGDLLATGDGEGAVRIFSAETGDLLLGPLEGHATPVWALGFRGDGEALASGSADGTVVVHDTRSGEVLHRPDGHEGPVSAAVYVDDRLYTAGGSGDDANARTWDSSGRAVGRPVGPHPGGRHRAGPWAGRPAHRRGPVGHGGALATRHRRSAGAVLPPDANTVWAVGLVARPPAARRGQRRRGGARLGRGPRCAARRPHGPPRRGDRRRVPRRPGDARDRQPQRGGAALGRRARPAGRRRVARPRRRGVAGRRLPERHPVRDRSEDGTVRVWDVLDVPRSCARAVGAFDAERRRQYLGQGESAAGYSR